MANRGSRALLVALMLSTVVPAHAAPAVPARVAIEPAAMIALADTDPQRGHKGLYRMVVKSAAKPSAITFLNSQTDYRAAGDVTFSLSPAVGAALAKRLGRSPHEALVGRTVTVEGILIRTAIVNTINQRAHGFNRWSYQVRIDQVAQIREISG